MRDSIRWRQRMRTLRRRAYACCQGWAGEDGRGGWIRTRTADDPRMTEIRVSDWNELNEQLYGNSFNPHIGRIRSTLRIPRSVQRRLPAHHQPVAGWAATFGADGAAPAAQLSQVRAPRRRADGLGVELAGRGAAPRPPHAAAGLDVLAAGGHALRHRAPARVRARRRDLDGGLRQARTRSSPARCARRWRPSPPTCSR